MSMRIGAGVIAAGLVCAAAGVANAGSNFSLFIGGGAPVGGYYGPAPVYGPPVYHDYYYHDYHYAPPAPVIYGGYGGWGRHHHHHHHRPWHGHHHHHHHW